MDLWPGGVPESNGITDPEYIEDSMWVRNISKPVLYVYKPEPDKNTGAAIVICPGGGYELVRCSMKGTNMPNGLPGAVSQELC